MRDARGELIADDKVDKVQSAADASCLGKLVIPMTMEPA
jgi:hypothetical protein